jgi:hypothetical protein
MGQVLGGLGSIIGIGNSSSDGGIANKTSNTQASQDDHSKNIGNGSILNEGTYIVTDAGATNAALKAIQDTTDSAFASNAITNAAAFKTIADTTDSAFASNAITTASAFKTIGETNTAAFDAMGKTNESALSLAEKTVSGVLDAITLTAQQPSSSGGGVYFSPSSSTASEIPRSYIILAVVLIGAGIYLNRKK